MNHNNYRYNNARAWLDKKWRNCGKSITEFEKYKSYAAPSFNSREETLAHFVEEFDFPEAFSGPLGILNWEAFFETILRRYRQEIVVKNNQTEISIDPEFTGDIDIPEGSTVWGKYLERLQSDSSIEYEDVLKTKISCQKIFNSIHANQSRLYKGLVIGSVQSGKTLNMLGVVAATVSYTEKSLVDTVIILTSNVKNLQYQTGQRVFDDLIDGITNVFHYASEPWKSGIRYDSLNVGVRDSQCKFITCVIKEKQNLTKLTHWLRSGNEEFLKNRKILIIDDEADWGSPDSSKKDFDRSKISSYVVELLNLNKVCEKVYYLCYTATPYANVLNEPGLYPESYITALQRPKSYFGVHNIFGDNDYGYNNYDEITDDNDLYDGDIYRTINEQEETYIKEYELGDITSIQCVNCLINNKSSFFDSVCYFLCVDGAKRFLGLDSSNTMLIHTHIQRQKHRKIYNLVLELLKNYKEEILKHCCNIWKEEIGLFTKKDFYNKFPEYPNKDINDYPKWADIKKIIETNLKSLHSLEADENGDLIFNKDGICLVEDNSNGTRISYPRNKQNFSVIVIGGLTLSRGLTLKGLTVSYFLRTTPQADTLYQMARWFGYRHGYEIFQRVWLSLKSLQRFVIIADMEKIMRHSLQRYKVGSTPKDFGPRILNAVPMRDLIPTSKNKMKNARDNYSFSSLWKQTRYFHKNIDKIKSNHELTIDFLGKLKDLDAISKDPKGDIREGYISRNVKVSKLEEFLDKFEIHPNCSYFKKTSLIQEFKKYSVVDVIIPTVKGGDHYNSIIINDKKIYKLPRALKKRKPAENNFYHFSTLVTDGTLVKSYPFSSKLFEEVRAETIRKGFDFPNNELIEQFAALRIKVPSLFIYFIDGNPKRRKDDRELSLPDNLDLIGLQFHFPEEEGSHSYMSFDTSKIPKDIQ